MDREKVREAVECWKNGKNITQSDIYLGVLLDLAEEHLTNSTPSELIPVIQRHPNGDAIGVQYTTSSEVSVEEIKGRLRCVTINGEDAFILYQDAKMSKGKLCELLAQALHSKFSKPRVSEEKYQELIMAVESKYPNETRHETALRYIQSCENRDCQSAVNQLIEGE